MCGRIRTNDSNQCVTVLNEAEESDKIFNLINCDEGKIFCYNSTTRFIKLQHDEGQCVAVVRNRLRLKACRQYQGQIWNDMTWGYMWQDELQLMEKPCLIGNLDQNSLGAAGTCQKFDFQLIKAEEPGSPSLRA